MIIIRYKLSKKSNTLDNKAIKLLQSGIEQLFQLNEI